MNPGERFHLDPRRLCPVEATKLELAGRGSPLPAADAARLAAHYAAHRDYALWRNTVPPGAAARAALADPNSATYETLKSPVLRALVRYRKSGEWTRTPLGDEVLALIEKDRNT